MFQRWNHKQTNNVTNVMRIDDCCGEKKKHIHHTHQLPLKGITSKYLWSSFEAMQDPMLKFYLRPLFFKGLLTPQKKVTRSSRWNLPVWKSQRSLADVVGGQLWSILSCYCGNPAIITMPFDIYLVEIGKTGRLQVIHNFRPQTGHQIKKNSDFLLPANISDGTDWSSFARVRHQCGRMQHT